MTDYDKLYDPSEPDEPGKHSMWEPGEKAWLAFSAIGFLIFLIVWFLSSVF